jgi:hypothetical protein
VRLRLAVVAALALLPARAAHAGLGRFGWLVDTDVVPERAVEFEQWASHEAQQGPAHQDETVLSWLPVVGITDRVELALPVELTWVAAGDSARTSFTGIGAEVRWRLVSNDPVDAPPFAPLIRVGIKHLVIEPNAVEVTADLAGSYHCHRLHVVGNVGVDDTLRSGADTPLVRGGAGISIGVTDELRLGAEGFAQLALTGSGDDTWVAAGPNLAWSPGRFWLSAAVPVGLYQIQVAPRFTWAIAF